MCISVTSVGKTEESLVKTGFLKSLFIKRKGLEAAVGGLSNLFCNTGVLADFWLHYLKYVS